MNTSSRILIGTLVTFLIMGAGIAVGFYFSKNRVVSTEEKTALAEKNAEPNFNTYDISPPSRATTIETKEVPINPAGNTAFVMMPKKDAGDIKTGQKILLHDAKGVLLETLGEVTAVNAGSGPFEGQVTVHMILNGDANVDATKAASGRIVTNRIPDSARLPLSALVKNEKGEPYIWEATQNDDGTTSAWFKRINIAATTYDYFVIEQTSPQGGIYILNPDGDLRDGQKINVKKILYAGPLQADDSRIEELMKSRSRARDSFAASAAARAAAPAAQGPGQNTCAPSPDVAKQFIQTIQNMTPVPAQSTPATP